MTDYINGQMIKKLREDKKMTQKDLANLLSVSEKTVSKWETLRGLPDICLLSPIAKALGVSLSELVYGYQTINDNRCANLKKSCFYVCPICGNIVYSSGSAVFSCCGVNLIKHTCDLIDDDSIKIEIIDDEYYVFINHDQTKTHYISFIAYVTSDTCTIKKLYPEGSIEASFKRNGHGTIYAYCNKDGLFQKRI